MLRVISTFTNCLTRDQPQHLRTPSNNSSSPPSSSISSRSRASPPPAPPASQGRTETSRSSPMRNSPPSRAPLYSLSEKGGIAFVVKVSIVGRKSHCLTELCGLVWKAVCFVTNVVGVGETREKSEKNFWFGAIWFITKVLISMKWIIWRVYILDVWMSVKSLTLWNIEIFCFRKIKNVGQSKFKVLKVVWN